MKKKLIIFIIVIICPLLMFTACFNNNTKEYKETTVTLDLEKEVQQKTYNMKDSVIISFQLPFMFEYILKIEIYDKNNLIANETINSKDGKVEYDAYDVSYIATIELFKSEYMTMTTAKISEAQIKIFYIN